MRSWSLISLLLVGAACTVRVPRPGDIAISVKSSVKATAHVQTQVQVAPPVAVPLQGATVVEFFGVPLEGAQDVVFVLDCSGSMEDAAQGRIAQIQAAPAGTPPPPPDAANPPPDPANPPPDAPNPPPTEAPAVSTQPRKIDVAQAELVDALGRLPAGTRLNVVFFNSALDVYSPTMVVLDDAGRAGLAAFVKGTEPVGSTALTPAMRAAFLMNARRIVLLSDGLGNVGGTSGDLLRDAREAMRGGVRIDTIGLGATQNSNLLSTLARESGGLYQAL